MDENTIIEILVKRSNAQRQQIKEAYQQASGKVKTITHRFAYQNENWYENRKSSVTHISTCPQTFAPVVVCPQSLESALKSALKGDLEDVVLALLKTPSQYDAYLLKQAMKVH